MAEKFPTQKFSLGSPTRTGQEQRSYQGSTTFNEPGRDPWAYDRPTRTSTRYVGFSNRTVKEAPEVRHHSEDEGNEKLMSHIKRSPRRKSPVGRYIGSSNRSRRERPVSHYSEEETYDTPFRRSLERTGRIKDKDPP
ncbi:hypothetical protein AJ80_03103 [Polytolypa hystricis UAMH7299]|uniref:Uncharacterized protein n=1 Tax=Polytolypa hystricis (strain UAMH7299) TaxID=1447883 RepID=A0A2B7YKK1_POLH7|nr:hypothetical protein AJ80_03103 [Polytolypa hystricis UAMH7299]